HRIGICRKVDRIIVMKDGQVAEMGNHETLLGMRGEYYRLYMAQRKWYAPEGRSSNGYEG
ncbi:MAG TPA: ABC transporter ATP-binding protein, partial [Candidatus Pullilachnospira stercoravium]|nr:ABC transporter ATP-binding protein [Candidatus Pullilachnospira stercoravium]